MRALGDEKDGKGPSYINNVCLPEGPTQFAGEWLKTNALLRASIFLFAVYAKARKTARVPISGDDTICFYTLDYKDRCWVAAWGQKLERQREVDLPLLGAAECQAKLQPVFTAKGRGSYTTALYAAETECTVYSTLQDS